MSATPIRKLFVNIPVKNLKTSMTFFGRAHPEGVSPLAIREHLGSCHCGAVRFFCSVDWSRGSSRCNCSVCGKSRFWKAVIPAAAFRLLSGQEALGEYRFGRGEIVHHFCRRCGVKTFGTGAHEALGGAFYAVNVACLDDLSAEELAALPVQFALGARWRGGTRPRARALLPA
jgi:hypothetical protein